MSQLSINKFGDNLPVSSIVGFSQAALGFGAGLLLAGQLGGRVRTRVAVAAVAAGVAALSPMIAGIISNVQNRPTSSRRMRRQLESIRRDTGISDNGHEF